MKIKWYLLNAGKSHEQSDHDGNLQVALGEPGERWFD